MSFTPKKYNSFNNHASNNPLNIGNIKRDPLSSQGSNSDHPMMSNNPRHHNIEYDEYDYRTNKTFKNDIKTFIGKEVDEFKNNDIYERSETLTDANIDDNEHRFDANLRKSTPGNINHAFQQREQQRKERAQQAYINAQAANRVNEDQRYAQSVLEGNLEKRINQLLGFFKRKVVLFCFLLLLVGSIGYSVYSNYFQSYNAVVIDGNSYKVSNSGSLEKSDFEFTNKRSTSFDKAFEYFIKSKAKKDAEAAKKNQNKPKPEYKSKGADDYIQALIGKGSADEEDAIGSAISSNVQNDTSDIVNDLESSVPVSGLQGGNDNYSSPESNVEDNSIEIADNINPDAPEIEAPAPAEAATKPAVEDRRVWQVQLFSAASYSETQQKWRDIQKENPRLFVEKRAHIVKAIVDGKNYWRLRVGNSMDDRKGYFTTKRSGDSYCKLLKSYSVDCYTVETQISEIGA